jgi:hypothetical protein
MHAAEAPIKIETCAHIPATMLKDSKHPMDGCTSSYGSSQSRPITPDPARKVGSRFQSIFNVDNCKMWSLYFPLGGISKGYVNVSDDETTAIRM